MITADQLVAHAIGDYILQSDWMATNKTSRSWPALAHALTYTLPFLVFSHAPLELLVIAGSHFVIDRWRLARYLVWAKNFLAPRWIAAKPESGGRFRMVRTPPWRECVATGYPPERPAWLTVWLMIVADNTCHVLINGWALS